MTDMATIHSAHARKGSCVLNRQLARGTGRREHEKLAERSSWRYARSVTLITRVSKSDPRCRMATQLPEDPRECGRASGAMFFRPDAIGSRSEMACLRDCVAG